MEIPSAIMIKLPEVFGAREARRLRREWKKKLAREKPGVVVDLSRVKKMDLSGIEALLSCMEEVARQDGSVELGGISPEAAALLELTRVNELFQKFPSSPVGAEGTVVLGEAATEVEPTGTRAVQPQPVAA